MIPLAGIADVEHTARGVRPHRLPAWVRAQFPDPQLLMVEAQPAGVRVALTTAARTIDLVTHPSRVTYRGFDRPRGRIDLVIDGKVHATDVLTGGDLTEIDLATGATTASAGPAHTSTFGDLPAGDKVVELWLPHNESVEIIELRADAPTAAAPPQGRVWLHHGSSISQGSNATTPARTWPSVAARAAGVDLRNLGLGGSAMADPFLARVMRDSKADLISVKLGINVVNADAMRLRAFVPAVHGFLDTIRDGHPDTPLLLISPIHCGLHEDTPGPGTIDTAAFQEGRLAFGAAGTKGDTAQGRLTLRVIRDAMQSVAEQRSDDKHLHYLDGTTLYAESDADGLPLPDGLHPDTETHRLIGERFARHVFAPGGPFAGR